MQNKGLHILLLVVILFIAGGSHAVAQHRLWHSYETPCPTQGKYKVEDIVSTLINYDRAKDITSMLYANPHKAIRQKASSVSYINSSHTSNSKNRDKSDNDSSLFQEMTDTLNSIATLLTQLGGFDKKSSNGGNDSHLFFNGLITDNAPKCRHRGERSTSNNTQHQLLPTSNLKNCINHNIASNNLPWHSRMEMYGYFSHNNYVDCKSVNGSNNAYTHNMLRQTIAYTHMRLSSLDDSDNTMNN